MFARFDLGQGSGRELCRCLVRAPLGRAALAALAVSSLAAVSCGRVERSPLDLTTPAPERGATIVALQIEQDPAGPDAPPRFRLLRRSIQGSTTPIAGEYIDAVEFRTGVAAVTPRRELELVRPDGSRSTLAHEIDGLPARAPDGSLVYAARFGDVVEIHRLSSEGDHRRLASFSGTATRLTPQPDGRVVFVGARSGGVSGMWIADAGGAHCLTNCELRAGEPWGDAYRPPPGDPASVRVSGEQLEWTTTDGVSDSATLEVAR